MIFNKLRWQASSGCERLPWQRAPWQRSKRKTKRSRHPDDLPSVHVSPSKGSEEEETSSRSPLEIEAFKPNMAGRDLQISLREAHVEELQEEKNNLEKELQSLRDIASKQGETQQEIKLLQSVLREKKQEIEELLKLIEQLKQQKAELSEQHKADLLALSERERAKRERSLSELIRKRDIHWEQKLTSLNKETQIVKEKLSLVEKELKQAHDERDKLVQDKNREQQITMDLEYEKSVVLSSLQSVKEQLQNKDDTCQTLGLDLKQARLQLKEKDELIQELKGSLSQRDQQIKVKDEQIKSSALNHQFEKVAFFTPKAEFDELQEKLREKDQQIRQLSDRITKQQELLSAFEELDLLRTQKEKRIDLAKTSPCSEDEKQEFLSVREQAAINRSWNISPVRTSSIDEETKERLEHKISGLEEEVREYRRKLQYYQSRETREDSELMHREKELERKDTKIKKLKTMLEDERRKMESSHSKRNQQQMLIVQQEKEILRLTEEREKLKRVSDGLKREAKKEKEEKDNFYIDRIQEMESYIDELEAHLKKYKKLERQRHEHMFDVDVQRPNSSMTEGISPSRLYFNQSQPLKKKASSESFKTFTTTTKLTVTRPSLV